MLFFKDVVYFFFYLLIFRGRKGEKHRCKSCILYLLDLGLNLQPFTLRDDAQPTEPHQSGISLFSLKTALLGLAGVAQWIGYQPANQRVASAILGLGTCLGCGLGPWLEACRRQTTDRRFSYTSLFLSPSPSLSSPLFKSK